MNEKTKPHEVQSVLESLKSGDSVCRIGTRGSPLALAQAREVRSRLMQAHELPETAFELVIIKTQGDRNWSKPLAELGGKELFTREIEDALLERKIDCAVHSSKDMPTELPDGLSLDIFLPREDTSDRLITQGGLSLDELPEGAVLGTSSLRRAALIRNLRSDIHLVDIRGNVETRLEKVKSGTMDATILASAGLNRLGIDIDSVRLEAPDFPPAPGQGAISIERRTSDEPMQNFLAVLDHKQTHLELICERSFLATLDGSCRTPIAAKASLKENEIFLVASVLSPDGKKRLDLELQAPASQANILGKRAADELIQRGGKDLLDNH